MIFQILITSILLNLFIKHAVARKHESSNLSVNIMSHHEKLTDLKTKSTIVATNYLKTNKLRADVYGCTKERMENILWEEETDVGFLCGPKSDVNEYSVIMLPKGMYFYHGSDSLPLNKIPGGQIKGIFHYNTVI